MAYYNIGGHNNTELQTSSTSLLSLFKIIYCIETSQYYHGPASLQSAQPVLHGGSRQWVPCATGGVTNTLMAFPWPEVLKHGIPNVRPLRGRQPLWLPPCVGARQADRLPSARHLGALISKVRDGWSTEWIFEKEPYSSARNIWWDNSTDLYIPLG